MTEQERSESTPPHSFEIELYHRHLPKLEDEGVIEWDADTQTVSRGPMFEEIEPALHALVANADTFPTGLL